MHPARARPPSTKAEGFVGQAFIISTIIYILVMLFFFALLASFGYKWYSSKNQIPTISPPPEVKEQQADTRIDDEALKNALNLYAEQKKKGTDLSNGPCLGAVAPDWVLDIVHNPRQVVDDKEENQCREFREGKARHFIEFDPDGKLIRAF